MTRVYVADAKPEERSALRLLLLDLQMDVVGEASDWYTTLTQAPGTCLDMLLVEWSLLPNGYGRQALAEFRLTCPHICIVILISHLYVHQQVAFAAGADAFISNNETPERVADRLRQAAASLRVVNSPSAVAGL